MTKLGATKWQDVVLCVVIDLDASRVIKEEDVRTIPHTVATASLRPNSHLLSGEPEDLVWSLQ